jgi:hypothetical protein
MSGQQRVDPPPLYIALAELHDSSATQPRSVRLPACKPPARITHQGCPLVAAADVRTGPRPRLQAANASEALE